MCACAHVGAVGGAGDCEGIHDLALDLVDSIKYGRKQALKESSDARQYVNDHQSTHTHIHS